MTSGVGPMKAMPASSTFRANSAFSDKKPYLRCRKVGGGENPKISVANSSPRMDHIDPMLEGNANDIVLREIRGNGGQAGTDMICFISLGDG